MINKQSATQRKSKEKSETKKFTTKKTKSQGLQKRFALNQVREDPRIPN